MHAPDTHTQWAHALAKPSIMRSAPALTAALRELCLERCAPDAAGALAAVHKQLDDLTVGASGRRQGLLLAPPRAARTSRARGPTLAVPARALATRPPPPTTLRAPPPQAPYASLGASSSVPITLEADLQTLTKLAKIGQAALPDGVAACCAAGGAGGPLANYTSGLGGVVANTTVNNAAISDAVNSTYVPPANAATSLAGRLINNGGITGCRVRAAAAAGEGAWAAGARVLAARVRALRHQRARAHPTHTPTLIPGHLRGAHRRAR